MASSTSTDHPMLLSFFPTFFVWVLLSSVSFLSDIVRSQEYSERGPHGLAQESPTTFSPEAFNFFHPDSPLPSPPASCADNAADCAPVSSFFKPMATKVQESADEGTVAGSSHRHGVGAAGAVGVVFGCFFVVAAAMGTFYVFVKRRRNVARANTVHPPPV